MAFEVLWMQANSGDEALVAATSARQNRQLIDVLLTEGVVDVDGGDFAASEHADEWKVTVAAGRAVVAGDDQADQGKYLVTMTTDADVALNPPPGADKRIDVIYLQVLDPNASGDAGYTAELGFVEGATHATTPVAPDVPDTAIAVCSVLRESTDATWADASITDLREGITSPVPLSDSGTVRVVKAVQTDYVSNTTLGTDSELQFEAEANETYFVDAWLRVQGAQGGDLKVDFSVPAGATCVFGAVSLDSAATRFDATSSLSRRSMLASAASASRRNVASSPQRASRNAARASASTSCAARTRRQRIFSRSSMRAPLRDRVEARAQPLARGAPVAIRGALGDAERGGDFGDFEADEPAQFDALGHALVDFGEFVERAVERLHVDAFGGGHVECRFEIGAAPAAAMLVGRGAAGAIDERLAHHA